jgi:hypothetical protein
MKNFSATIGQKEAIGITFKIVFIQENYQP